MRTKAKLASESERLQFALGEIDILNKQLQREKLSFENAYVLFCTLRCLFVTSLHQLIM